MSGTTLRIIIAFVLFVHGAGHSMGVLAAVGLSSIDTWNPRSWLLTNILGDTLSRIICIILFAAALVGFVAAALGLMGWVVPHDLWRTLALVSAVVSLIAIILFWNAFVAFFPNKVGAIAVNVAVLVCLLWLNWPSETDIGF